MASRSGIFPNSWSAKLNLYANGYLRNGDGGGLREAEGGVGGGGLRHAHRRCKIEGAQGDAQDRGAA